MTNDATRDFAAIQRLALHLAPKLRKLEGEPDDLRWKHWATQTLAIGEAMSLIAKTPNACLNAEALAAFDAVLEKAHEALSDWCDRLLTPRPEHDETEGEYYAY